MKAEESEQRRQRLVDKVRLKPELGQGLDEAKKILQTYLKERHKNTTPEREFILWVIYHLDSPFDIDTLHALVCEHKSRVCRVTVYNNLLLFVEAGIVSRFQPFVDGTLYFEKTLGHEPHGYQICRRCGSIKPINLDKVIGHVNSQLSRSFHATQISLYAIGLCCNCHAAERKAVKATKKQWGIKDKK